MDEYRAISADVWGVFKKYAKPNPTDKEMVDCINEFDAVSRKHEIHHEYARLYIDLCVDEIDKIWKEREKIK